MSRLLGHRGTFLLMFGLIYVSIGVGIRSVQPSNVQAEGLHYLTVFAGQYDRLGWLWIVGGLTAAVFAFTRPFVDRWGFYALMLPSIAWAASYCVAAVLGGHTVLILAALVYSALATAVGTSAAWPEPPQKP